jgi:hypothetical protein
MRSIAELRDQLAEAQEALAVEEQELRRVEMLAEKESGSASPMPLAAAAQGIR